MNLFPYESYVNSHVSDYLLSKSNYHVDKAIDCFLNYLIKHVYNTVLRNYNFVLEEVKKKE